MYQSARINPWRARVYSNERDSSLEIERILANPLAARHDMRYNKPVDKHGESTKLMPRTLDII